MFNFTSFIRRKWAEVSPSSGQKGTAVDELAVKPAGLILSDFYNTLVEQRKTNDITNWQSMTQQQLDFFGNKFFMPRLYGDYAFGTVRIWFDTKSTIEISANVKFTNTNGLEFVAVQPGFISASSFKRSTDRFALYYVDVQVVAKSSGNAYNVGAGDITQITGASFSYKTVSNPTAFVGGAKFENNEQYYKRLLYSVNDRSMMNKRSIFAKLPEFFPIIRSIYLAGAGDYYMKRDMVEAISATGTINRSDFLGKTTGENIVKSTGFYQIYPFEAGNDNAATWGPNSIPTEFSYPLTIESINPDASEPAYHGYAINQECTDDMYKGLFFDDFKTYMEVRTNDLFNIQDEPTSFQDVIVPSTEWVYGIDGETPSTFGLISKNNNGVSLNSIDILNFRNNVITMRNGTPNSIVVGKDIKKRTGVKIEGTIMFGDTIGGNIQIMVGGIPVSFSGGSAAEHVDGYTGVGFGVRIFDVWKDLSVDQYYSNAAVYFAHGEKYNNVQVFVTTSDSGYNITQTGALAETVWRVEPFKEYDFEFIIHDDLRLSLYLNRVDQNINDSTNKENKLLYDLSGTALKVFGNELLSPTSSQYGTMMKIVLEAPVATTGTWTITNLRAFDISEKKATAMFALNVDALESPINIYTRASGISAVGNLAGEGYIAYIWDREAQNVVSGTSELTTGAWTELPALSNPDGAKDVFANLLSAEIFNTERYRIQNRFGNNIFLMFTTSGTSKLKSRYIGDTQDDVHSILNIDYIKAESGLTTAYHANNKADIHLSTLSNSENLSTITSVLTKSANQSYFSMSLAAGCTMPVSEIISISIGNTINESQILSKSDYSVVIADKYTLASSREELRIYLINIDSDRINVEYNSYPSIREVQDFFDGNYYGKIFGDILVKHKLPINLSFSVYYFGKSTDTQLADAIKTYFDQNVSNVFIVKDMVNYLYANNFVSNIKEPIQFSYTRYNDQNVMVGGEFSDSIEATDIDFFRIASLSVGVI